MCVSYRVFRWIKGHPEETQIPLLMEFFPLAPGEAARTTEELLALEPLCSQPLTGPSEYSDWYQQNPSAAVGYAPGEEDVLGNLIADGAKVDATDGESRTALHLAASQGPSQAPAPPPLLLVRAECGTSTPVMICTRMQQPPVPSTTYEHHV